MTISEQIEKLEEDIDAMGDDWAFDPLLARGLSIICQLTAPPTEGEIAHVTREVENMFGEDIPVAEAVQAAISAFLKGRGCDDQQ